MAWRHPQLLWLAALAVGLAFAYAVALRPGRRPYPVRFPTDPLRQALSLAGRRRHLPAALFASSIVAALVGAAGPMLRLPSATGTPVVLVIDISRSMEETDIAPSRIEAAKTAGIEFARHLPRASRLAVVSFGNFASVVVPLTSDRSRVIAGIEALTTQLRTQLGTGLVEGVRALTGESVLPQSPSPQAPFSPFSPFAPSPPAPLAPSPPTPPSSPPLPPPAGVRGVAIVLSDGRASDGIPPQEAAEIARARGVRVHTVGLGTDADPSTFRSGYYGVLDEPTLRMIADTTGGRYHRAEEAGRLREIYRDLARTIGWTRALADVSALAAAAALILLTAAVALRALYVPLA